MRQVPRKNIPRLIADVVLRRTKKGQGADDAVLEAALYDDEEPIRTTELVERFGQSEVSGIETAGIPSLDNPARIRRVVLGSVSVLVAVVVLFALSSYRSQQRISDTASQTFARFESAVGAFGTFDTGSSGTELSSADPKGADTPSFWGNFSSFFEGFKLFLKDSGATLKGFEGLTSNVLYLGQKFGELKDNWPKFVFEQQGGQLIASIQDIHTTLGKIVDQGGQLSAKALQFKNILPFDAGTYLPLQLEAKKFHDFLGAFLGWLSRSEGRRIAVFFQNPSEIRPGGGFIGSYAELTIRNGNLENIEVRDVNESDRTLDLKTIPPKPLQALVTTWRAADANWFFDFSLSAAKVIEFLEASDFYKEKSFQFDGAIGLSSEVIGDLLGLVGPIELKDRGIVVDQKNFLVEIQRQVELGLYKGAEHPKSVLKELVPRILEKLANMEPKDRDTVFGLMGDWLAKKEVLVYFKDSALERFFDQYNWTGKTAVLDPAFNGDYLAVVAANIGGGKTDIVLDQTITLTSQMDLDGTVSNHLVVSREHRGNTSKYDWYRVPNQSYIRVYTPPAVRLTNASGGIEKKISPPTDYKTRGYSEDPLVASIESTARDYLGYAAVKNFDEFGKNVFATWSKVERGKKAELVFDYSRKLFAAPRAGQSYQFVFEKQAGTRNKYVFEINAPVGFRWRESNLPSYEFRSDDPPGRVVIDLTLAKI